MKRLLLLPCLMLCAPAFAQDERLNIIFVIGDGMGYEYVSAYRLWQDDPTTTDVEATLFDEWAVGSASTSPHDPRQVTDSAAGATALASGVKTYNGAIGLDVKKQPVETLLERAKKSGYTTAMVATSQINHATPASFAAHTDSRHNYDEIANQYLDNRHDDKPFVDLLMGGGRAHFAREDRNLIAEFQNAGYQYVDSLSALDKLTELPAMALVAEEGLPNVVNQGQGHHLTQMTEKALALLDGQSPFFLVVEASQIDWCGHANDIACAMGEMADTENALKVIRTYIEKRPNTLVVVTADHSTGGLSIGAEGVYRWDSQALRRIRGTVGTIAEHLVAAENWEAEWQSLTGMELSEAQQDRIESRLADNKWAWRNKTKKKAWVDLIVAVKEIINTNTHTGWTTGEHTGGDVPVMAYGQFKQRFAGHQDNTDIARRLFELLPRQ